MILEVAWTHLDPVPDGGEEGGRVDDGDRAERLGVVGRRECGGFLEVRAEGPEGGERALVEVDNCRDGRDGRRRGVVREVRAEPEDETGHGLVERDAVGGMRWRRDVMRVSTDRLANGRENLGGVGRGGRGRSMAHMRWYRRSGGTELSSFWRGPEREAILYTYTGRPFCALRIEGVSVAAEGGGGAASDAPTLSLRPVQRG